MEKKNNKSFWIIALVLVLLLGGAGVGYQLLMKDNAPDTLVPTGSESAGGSAASSAPEAGSENPEEQPPEKVALPDFTVYDREGNPFRLSDFKGKPTILNFWASWCGPCRSEMADFNEKYLELGEEINFVMVNATDGQRETVEIASQFVEEAGYEFPVYYDTSLEANLTFGIRGLPTTFFIDEEGYAVAVAQSAISAEILRQGVDMIYTAD